LTALTRTLATGTNDSLLPIFNTASLVVFGSMIASLTPVAMISAWVTTAGGDKPLIFLITTGTLVGTS